MSWGVATQNGVSVSLASIVSLSCGATEFSPASLFTSGVAGAWYDPSDVLLNWRTNLLTYSQEFDNAAWTKTGGSTITANSVTAPDGTTTADTLVLTTGSGTSQLFQSTGSITGPVTASIWIRADSALSVDFGFYDSAGDVSTFSVTTEWQRITKTRAAGLTSADRRACWLYKGTAGSGTVYIWGAQLELGSTATTYQAITTPEQTYLLYDPQPVLFQDSAGTTPVTAVEQPVGLMLDKSQGLAGTQQINDPSFDSGIAGWGAQFPGADVTFAWNSTLKSMTVTRTGAGITGRPTYPISVVAGTWYKITFVTNAAGVTNAASFGVSDSVGATAISGLGPQSVSSQTTVKYGVATTTGTAYVGLWCTTSASVDILSVEITAVAGNHASQATPTSCPVLRARYNLLTYSEQFDNAAWFAGSTTVSANQATAPDGTVTADLVYVATTGASRYIWRNASVFTVTAQVITSSFYVKASSWTWVMVNGTGTNTGVWFNISTGQKGTESAGYTGTITDAGSGWWRVTVTETRTGAVQPTVFLADANNSLTATASGTNGVYLWGAQLAYGSSAGTYQRIAAATDYATAGFLPYLAFDGTDDNLASGNINLTGTSKVSAFAGATKNNDSNVYAIVDFGASGGGTAGGFSMWAGSPTAGGAAVWASSVQSSAGGTINIISPANFAAPATAVLTTVLDTVNAGSYLRVNGTLQTTSAVDPTDGTFGNIPLRLSRTGANGLPGRIYGIIVAGKQASASEISATEAWMNSKTGAY